jgi:hypothetical protein
MFSELGEFYELLAFPAHHLLACDAVEPDATTPFARQ